MKNSWLHVWYEEEFPGELYEHDVFLLAELVAIEGDIASQSGHPINHTGFKLPEQDRPGEVEFDLLQPLLAVPVQLGGVRKVVVVQTLSLVNIWGNNQDDNYTLLQSISPSLSGGSSAMLQNSMLMLILRLRNTILGILAGD